MAAEREGVLLLARHGRFARVVFRDETGRQVDVGIAVHERGIRRDLVAAHRHEAHRLGAAGHDRGREAGHDPLGRRGDRLKPRRAEAVDRHGGRRHGHAGAQARDPRHVEPLLGFRHRAPDDHVLDLGRIEPGRATQGLRDHDRPHLVRARRAQRAFRRFPDSRPDGADDDSFLHGFYPSKSPSKSSSASPTSAAFPSKSDLAPSMTTSSFGSSSAA